MDYLKLALSVVIAFLLLFGLYVLVAFTPFFMIALCFIGAISVISIVVYEILDSF